MRALMIAAACATGCGGDGGGGDVDASGGGPDARATPAAMIVAGCSHTCATTPDGRAFCWGNNDAPDGTGALGDGTELERATPVPVAGGHVFRWIDAGFGRTCGITVGGETYCWGMNDF